MDGDFELLKRIYDRFNARDIDAVLAVLGLGSCGANLVRFSSLQFAR
jgi:hypothetical protein